MGKGEKVNLMRDCSTYPEKDHYIRKRYAELNNNHNNATLQLNVGRGERGGGKIAALFGDLVLFPRKGGSKGRNRGGGRRLRERGKEAISIRKRLSMPR